MDVPGWKDKVRGRDSAFVKVSLWIKFADMALVLWGEDVPWHPLLETRYQSALTRLCMAAGELLSCFLSHNWSAPHLWVPFVALFLLHLLSSSLWSTSPRRPLLVLFLSPAPTFSLRIICDAQCPLLGQLWISLKISLSSLTSHDMTY